MTDGPKRPRPWLRFGFRTLLVFTLTTAAFLGWLANRLAEGRRHERIAAELLAAGCSTSESHHEFVEVTTTTNFSGVMGVRYVEISTLPKWMESWGLAPAFRRIEGATVRTKNPAKIERAVARLKQLDSLTSLSFYQTGIRQDQLADLMNDVAIQKLYVPSEDFPRTRIEWLKNEHLTWLCLARTQFSNPAIDDLPTSLTYLDLTRTRINDDGLPRFVRLTNLRCLKLRRTPTSREAVEKLREQMPWCEISWEPLKR